MKLTKARLKRIIKEEIEKTIRLREATPGSGLRALQPSAPGAPDDDYEEEEESPIEAMVKTRGLNLLGQLGLGSEPI